VTIDYLLLTILSIDYSYLSIDKLKTNKLRLIWW